MIEITYFGHSCFRIKNKNVSLVIDPFSQEMTGLKLSKLSGDAVICTHSHEDHHDLTRVSDYRLIIDGPGEYEIGGAQIFGVPTFHDAKQGREKGPNICYEITLEGVTIVHLGDLGHKLEAKEVELLNNVDILMIPVGGILTIDSHIASSVISQLEPLMVIPMHYSEPGLKFQLDPLENFLKEMGIDKPITLPKLSISKDKLPEVMQILVLDKS